MLIAPSPMSLAQLVAGRDGPRLELIGDPEVSVSSLTEDSRQVKEGTLFVARRGGSVDGTRFAQAALSAGASAVLCERGSCSDCQPRVEASDLPEAFGFLAQKLAGHPSQRLSVIGITGTNGKTTTASLVSGALRMLGYRVATLGTLGFFVDRQHLGDTLTTPPADELADALRRAVEAGARYCVMEVSSHALDQKRTDGVRFVVAAFTNLSQDHLDYHGTMEAYGAAKERLFRARPCDSVINVSDSFGRQLASRIPDRLRVRAHGDVDADLVLQDAELNSTGTSARLAFRGESAQLESRLLGQHNLDNIAVATGILLALGFSLQDAARSFDVGQAPGRLERCDGPEDDVIAVVDYAHTPDALFNVLAAVRKLGSQRLICIFGCGGDRDKKKRPLMGQAAADWADEIWVTNDNPRGEDPEEIVAAIRAGLRKSRVPVFEELDRRRAILRAVQGAPPGSLILVAGKGHETYQIVGKEVRAFDDREELRRALASRRGGSS